MSVLNPWQLNEKTIEGLLDEILRLPCDPDELTSLCLARLTELALFCAGNYADACEYRSANDLLCNPRKICIYVKGGQDAVTKNRHGALTRQLAALIERQNPVKWMAENTLIRIAQGAMLPFLYEQLQHAGGFSSRYLDSIKRRMCRVADTLTFLSSWQVSHISELYQKLAGASPETRLFVEQHLCRFDLDLFVKMGQDLDLKLQPPRMGEGLKASTAFERSGTPCFD